ncbi:unnamed protein product [Trifolium pratense]|uniref:Uncharacterized protein n=1 Tax=Trifolium pratense TaxID=57577 RepID=A0ACB0KMR8_TRIPR|nr:unnamed protein product [Trifolium pratense]
MELEGETKPWLMYFSAKAPKNLTFCSITDPTKSYSTTIPDDWSKPYLRLCTVQHGWFLWEDKISNYDSKFFLWNPLNLEKIMLPPLKHCCNSFGNCILSSPPTTCDEICSIFLFSSHSPSIFYYQLGDKQWTKLCSYDDIVKALAMKGAAPRRGRLTLFEEPVYFRGCLSARMWTTIGIIVVAIEVKPNVKLRLGPLWDRQPPIISGFEQIICKLIGFDNVIFRIKVLHAHDRVVAVFVHKSDCYQGVWEKVENIKDKVFFISCYDSAFACQAINPETEGSRIYIALKNCNFFYIYNIEDKSLATSQHFSNLSKTLAYSMWFMPETRMTGPLKEEIGKAHQVRQRESISEVVHSKDTEDKAPNGLSLPRDVIEVIAKRINNVLDYLHFRASNKLLRQAAPPIQWRSSSSMSMSRFDDLSMCPIFAFSEKDKIINFVHPKHGLEYKNIIKFPQNLYQFMNYEICCSKDGWLLLVAFQRGYQVFFNPFTKEVLPLPSGNKRISNIRCFGMSHSPTSYECVTVELIKIKNITTAHVHQLREGRHRLINFEDKKFPLFNINPAFHNGLFYFLSVTGKLAIIEEKGEEISWKILEKPQAPCSSHFNNFLVECDGNLLTVFESPFAKGVQVFKLNDDTMTWMKVTSLKNHMLFVGKTSFSAVANIPGMENKIYFNRFYGDSVVFYSLETNNYHTFKNDEVVNFHHVREQLNGTWIQPKWHQV